MKNRDWLENSNDWQTPDYLYDELNNEFNFDFDPCPYESTFDGLSPDTKWGKSNFINPPYDRVNKPKFIKRAYREWKENWATCVLLIPSATWTKQFHEIMMPHAEIRFVKWRIAFKWFNTEWKWTEKK